MPRKPTSYSRLAEGEVRRLIATSRGKKETPLPSVRSLAQRMDVSYATISRIMSRLGQELVVWQHPNGRFYPASAREHVSKALPIVVVGRQILHWSVLYREIIEGVSEVCTARGCPLVFLSSDKLVRHDSPDLPPRFASEKVQEKELTRLLSSLPKPYGGILFDHLWSDRLIAAARRLHPCCCMLVRGSPAGAFGSASVNAEAAAELILKHLAECGYSQILIGVPFADDQAVDASQSALERILASAKPAFSAVRVVDCSTPQSRSRLFLNLRRTRRRTALISLEDNITALLWRGFQASAINCPGTVGLISLQGTAVLGAPVTRLRYDYRRLGREAVASVLAETLPMRSSRPLLIRGRTVAPL
jgi:DNA-binding LacI/PurR family transcriptional regulator